MAPGGAQAHFGVTPDLATFGKAVASGFPVSCFAGRADLMDRFGSGEVMHGGTFNGHPACMAALVATLHELEKPGTFAALDRQGARLMQGIRAALGAADIQARVDGFPQIFHVGFGVESPVTDYRSSLQADKRAVCALHRGVAPPRRARARKGRVVSLHRAYRGCDRRDRGRGRRGGAGDLTQTSSFQ